MRLLRMMVLAGAVSCLAVLAGGVGVEAHAETVPLAHVQHAVLTAQMHAGGASVEARPLLYPEVVPDKPISGVLRQYAGAETDAAGAFVLLRLNGTGPLPDAREVRGAGAIIVYGTGYTLSNVAYRIPVLEISEEAGTLLELGASPGQNTTATIQFGPGTYGALDGARDVETFTVSNRAYALVTSSVGAQTIDITNYSRPLPASTIQSGVGQYHDIKMVTVSDIPYAVIGGKSGIEIIDMADPHNPERASIIRDGQRGYDTLSEVQDIEDFTVSGRVFVLASSYGDDGIQVIDVSNPREPLPVSSATDEHEGFEALRGAKGVDITTISGRLYAVVAGYGDDAIQVVDIINPYLPIPVSVFPNATQSAVLDGATDVEVVHTDEDVFAIVSSYNDDAIQIVNLTNPALPLDERVIIDGTARFDALGGATDIEIVTISRTEYGIVSGYKDDAIQVINLDNPALPRQVSTTLDDDEDADYDYRMDGAWGVDTVFLDGQPYAVVAGHLDDSVQIIDMGRPASPELTGWAFHPEEIIRGVEGAWGIDSFQIDGRTYGVLASYHDDAVQIMDLSDPQFPRPVSSVFDEMGLFEALDGATDAETVRINDRIYGIIASYNDDGVQIMDLTKPESPQHLYDIFDGEDGFEALDGAMDVEIVSVQGRVHAVVASYEEDAIQIIDVTNPAFPLPTNAIYRGTEYFKDEDIGEEDGRRVVGMDGPGGVGIATISGRTYAMVAGQNDDTIQVLDITNPSHPWPASYLYDGGNGFEALNGASDIKMVRIDGITYGVVASMWDGGVQIIDFSRPESPKPVSAVFDNMDGFEALNGAGDVEIVPLSSRVLAFVSSMLDDAVQIIDITEPWNPVPVQHMYDRIGGFEALREAGDIEAFIIDGQIYAMVVGVGDRAIQIMKVS